MGSNNEISGGGMRFHVVSLAHTNTVDAFSSCAFTMKVKRFCAMMKALGHTVYLYAGDKNDAPCDEHISCMPEEQRRQIVGGKHYTAADWSHPYFDAFNVHAIEQIVSRIQSQDFICLIGGTAQKMIADAFPEHLSVEFGIGYGASFANFRVFESYAWMHATYGAQAGNPTVADGQWFHDVIPNQIDPSLFPAGSGEGDTDGPYFLYVGRLIDRKGYKIAQEVCEKIGARLILAGPGEQSGYGEFVGEVGPERRAQLMGGADALFAPTIYLEPFGTVHIEAMACGTPVICTDWGVFTETIENGVNGFRCRMFADFVAAAYRVPDLSRPYIREAALQRFGMATVGRQYQRYFERLGTLFGAGWYA